MGVRVGRGLLFAEHHSSTTKVRASFFVTNKTFLTISDFFDCLVSFKNLFLLLFRGGHSVADSFLPSQDTVTTETGNVRHKNGQEQFSSRWSCILSVSATMYFCLLCVLVDRRKTFTFATSHLTSKQLIYRGCRVQLLCGPKLPKDKS